MLRAVPDTNVWVAAAITPRGLCGQLLHAAIEGRWQLVVSPTLMAELEEVLHRDKFRRWLSVTEATRFAAGIRALADVVDPSATSAPRTADPDDEFLLALARAASVVALISGDPHLTELLDPDPPVLTPSAFMNRLQV